MDKDGNEILTVKILEQTKVIGSSMSLLSDKSYDLREKDPLDKRSLIPSIAPFHDYLPL